MTPPGILVTLFAFVLVIGPLVFVHEMGHYLAARWFGVKAEAFSLGFGQELAGWTDRRGTRWKLGLLPLGGYVRFAGDMNPASQPDAAWLALPADERNRTFQAKPIWQRAIIVAAGPAVNFLLAALILAGFALAYGEAQVPPVIDKVVAGSAAAAAGLVLGDRITAIDGNAVTGFDDIARRVLLRGGDRVKIDYVRGGAPRETMAVIATTVQRDRFGNSDSVGRLGILSGKPVIEPVGLLRAPVIAAKQIGGICGLMGDLIGRVVTGRTSVTLLHGPVGTAKLAGEQLTVGAGAFVFLLAMVSINLGFINLLPVPMLDGGHLLFYAVEAVRRRPVEPKVMEWAFRGGLAAILALMLLVTANDLSLPALWTRLAGLIG